MSEIDPREEPVLIRPGAFNRKLDVREKVLLAILPPYVTLARTMARASWRKRRLDWGGLWNVPDRRGGFNVAGPAIGAPNSVTMLETLTSNGAKTIIVAGCCGSISEKVGVGDIIVPTDALSEEGVSAHYSPDMFPPKADGELVEKIKSVADLKKRSYHTGTVWTTDAPYRETCAKVKSYGEKGILGVEMELSALFTVARFRGVKIAAVLAVSDELASLKWKPGFLKPAFLSATGKVIGTAIDAIKQL